MGSAKYVYYGVRKVGINTYNCACLGRDVSQIVGGMDMSWHDTRDPVTTRDCFQGYLNPAITTLNNNIALMTFLKTSKAELTTKFTNPNDSLTESLVNLCNTNRTVNVVTLYMAAFLNLNIGTIVNSFVYDPTYQYSYPYRYPNNPGFTANIPKNVAGYPGTEQAYWTIVMQYTALTETNLRGFDNYWCSDQETVELYFLTIIQYQNN